MRHLLNYLTILILLVISTPTSIYAQETLPELKDWFLTTGTWNEDPELYVYELGTGPDTVVMLHGGWGGDHVPLITAVKDVLDKYHFIFYDQRGSLRSPAPDSLITYENHIEDLELLRKELGISKLKIVAHSMGAVLGAAYASKYPKYVDKLVVISPAQMKNPISEEDLAILEKSQKKFEPFLNRPEVQKELNTYSLSRDTPPLSSKEESSKFRIYFAARMLYDVRNWKHLGGGRALYKGHVFSLTANSYPKDGWDFPAFFQKSNMPVRIIMGDHDFLDFGAAFNTKWSHETPSSKLFKIKDAGHFIWIDQPDLFTEALLKALES